MFSPKKFIRFTVVALLVSGTAFIGYRVWRDREGKIALHHCGHSHCHHRTPAARTVGVSVPTSCPHEHSHAPRNLLTRKSEHPLKVSTLYGDVVVDEQILIDLINSRCFQRLKDIQQYGPNAYVMWDYKYSRYDHSLGVFYILRKAGASLIEQIAGLLHDASHTVFSHVADQLFQKEGAKDSYQDEIHEHYLSCTDVKEIVEGYGITVDDIHHKLGGFAMLERDLPELCADRIEYNMQGGYLAGLLTLDEVHYILNHLKWDETQHTWYFTDLHAATLLARVPLTLSMTCWSSPCGLLNDRIMATMLKRGVEIGLLTYDDIHYGTDSQAFAAIEGSQDPVIKQLYAELKNPATFEQRREEAVALSKRRGKNRGINPLVEVNGKRVRLLESDAQLAQEFRAVTEYFGR